MPVDPLDFTNKFNTPIPPEKQAAYDQWAVQQKQKTGKDPRGDRYDYDVQGDWLAGAARDDRGHGSDQFKKPNHPTFSDQSQLSGQGGNVGGSWIDAPGMPRRDPANVDSTPGFFQPGATNQKYLSPSGLQRYFNNPRNGDTNVVPLPPVDIKPPVIDMQPMPLSSIFRVKQATAAPAQPEPSKRKYFGQK